jgi:pseudouridine-5'-phosphate glycosidase
LLSELSRRSGGRTLKANLALLEANAGFAGQVAVAYSALVG